MVYVNCWYYVINCIYTSIYGSVLILSTFKIYTGSRSCKRCRVFRGCMYTCTHTHAHQDTPLHLSARKNKHKPAFLVVSFDHLLGKCQDGFSLQRQIGRFALPQALVVCKVVPSWADAPEDHLAHQPLPAARFLTSQS